MATHASATYEIIIGNALNTVIESSVFAAKARRLLSEAELTGLTLFVAGNPTAGDLIPGTGGARKLRWALQGRGKSGGARVIYFFHNESLPLVLLTIYAKNERANISAADAIAFRKFAEIYVKSYGR